MVGDWSNGDTYISVSSTPYLYLILANRHRLWRLHYIILFIYICEKGELTARADLYTSITSSFWRERPCSCIS